MLPRQIQSADRYSARRYQSFDEVHSTPGRGYGRSRSKCPCPGSPQAASSPAGGRPADETFTIDRPGAGPYVLDETFTIESVDIEEDFEERIVEGPPGSPGSLWSSGYVSSQRSGATSASSDCPAPGFHPHLGQQYSPSLMPGQAGVSFFLPMSPPGEHLPIPQLPLQPVPPSVAWEIPWHSPEPLIPGLPRPPSPQQGPSGLQQASRRLTWSSSEEESLEDYYRIRGPDDLNIARQTTFWSELGIPPQPPPGLQCIPCEPEGTEMVQPIMEGIDRVVNYGFETLEERMQRVHEMIDIMTRMQGSQGQALRHLRELRRMANNSIEGYLRQASARWSCLGEFYSGVVACADNLQEGPSPNLQGCQQTSVVNQARYSELVRRAAVLSRAINRELCSDSSLLRQLLIAFENLEENIRRCRNFLPNLCRYISMARQRTATLQRFLTFSQCEFDQFSLEWQATNRPYEPPLCAEEYETACIPLETVQDPACANNLTVSTGTPTPPTSPRRGSWSPVVSPRGITNVLPRTPPDLPVRVQQWMCDNSPSMWIPRERPSSAPYSLTCLFQDYDMLEGQAVCDVSHSCNESNSLNESFNAMNQSHSSSD